MQQLSRRKFLGSVAGAAPATSLPRTWQPQAASPDRRRPNVLFFIVDDLRVELGCCQSMFGASTPHLDSLAASGVRFDRNYCQFPLCNPSRSSLMTGRRPTETGVLGNRSNFRTLHPDWVSLPQLFRENGDAALRTGKIFHGGLDDPKAWSEGGGIPDGDGGAGGRTLVVPRTEGPPPPYLKSPLPQDIRQAPTSDRIVVLDGNGEGHPDYATADLAIDYLRRQGPPAQATR
jgi:arylsulfatase A-like enzyme